jgi:hypothetical protein
MAGPNLSIGAPYPPTGHLLRHDAEAGIVNNFDTAIGSASVGQALVWNGSVYAPGTPSAGSLQYPTTGSQLQGMLNAQNAGTAGAIVLGPVTYTISTALLLYNGSTIFGMGPYGSTINYTGTGGNAMVASNQTVRGYSWNLSGFLLTDGGTGAVGINMVKQSNATITNVKVDGFTTGISLTGVGGETVYNRFVSCQVANATTGILLGTDGSNSNSFFGCRTNVCTLGVQITDSNQNIFVGCQFETGTNGVAITATANALSDYNSFTDCRFETLSGIRINVTSSNVRYTHLVGNAFFGSGTSDITDSGTRTMILDAYIGMKINSPTRPTVTGSKGGNAALSSLMTALSTIGLVTDSTT